MFMAVYLFINVPANFWHGHQDNPSALQEKSNKTVIAKAVDGAADCQVCNHHFATGLNDHCIFTVYNTLQTALVASHYTLPVYDAPVMALSNKGPPAVC